MGLSIEEFLKQYKTAVADSYKRYPWLADVTDSYGKTVSNPNYALDWADGQERAYGSDPDVASVLTAFGIPGTDPAAQAAGLGSPGVRNAANTGGALGITQPRATGGGNQPWSPYTTAQTNNGDDKNADYDTQNNLPPGVQNEVNVLGGRGQSKPFQRTTNPLDVDNMRRGWVGQGPVKANLAASYRQPDWQREVRRGTPTARAKAVDIPGALLPENTRMRGIPGTRVYSQTDGNWSKADYRNPQTGELIPLVYNANGRPSLGATNDNGDLLTSSANGRYMTAGLSGEAFDVMTGDSEFKQGWLHKVWFGDAGEDGIINSGDERKGDDWWGGVYTGVKWMGRAAFLTLEDNKRFLDSATGKVFGDGSAATWAEVWAQRPGIQNLDQMWSIDQTELQQRVGSGWGAGGKVLIDREDFQAGFGLTPGGKSWSIGVGAARAFGMDVDKGPGSMVSGFLDAAALIVTDPSTWLAPEVKLTQLPKAFAVGAKSGAKVLTPGMKGRRWAQARDAYADMAITASGGGDTGRMVYVPGSRLASRVAGRDVYWGLKPVGRPREMEVSAEAATRYAREGMEGIQGQGPLSTIGGDLIASYSDNELAEMPEARRALIDDRTRTSLPTIGLSASTMNTPIHTTEDAGEWAGSLWYSSDSPQGINRVLQPDDLKPIAGYRVEYPPIDHGSSRRYFAIDDILDQFQVDTTSTRVTGGVRDALVQMEERGSVGTFLGELWLAEEGIGLTQETIDTIVALKRLGLTHVPLNTIPTENTAADLGVVLSQSGQYDAWRDVEFRAQQEGSAQSDDADYPWWMEDEEGNAPPEPSDPGRLLSEILPHPDIHPLYAGASTNPIDTVDVARYKVVLDQLEVEEPLRLATSPRHRNTADSARPGQVPWFTMEFEPRGLHARINFDSPKMLVDEYQAGWTDMIEPTDFSNSMGDPVRMSLAMLMDRHLRGVYINRGQVEWLKQNGEWDQTDELALRQLDDTLLTLGGRHAQEDRTSVMTKFRGVGKWEGWEVHRADGVADASVVPVSPFARTPDGAIIIPPGGDQPINPAAQFADSMRVTLDPEEGGIVIVSGKRVDLLGHSQRTGQHFDATNRTMSGYATDPTQVNVTVAPTATDELFAGVKEIPQTRQTTRIDPNKDTYEPTVPRTGKKPSHVRGTTLPKAQIPDDMYVVGDVMDAHLSGGALKPRVPRGTPDELGDKRPSDMSRRRGNIRAYSDLEAAFRYQAATMLLSRLARALSGPGDQRLVYNRRPAQGQQATPVEARLIVDDAARQIGELFGEDVAAEFHRISVLGGGVPRPTGLSMPLYKRDQFAVTVEEPLMRALYGNDFDVDDLMGQAAWAAVDPTKIEVGMIDGVAIREGDAAVRKYADSGADIRIYAPVKPHSILRDTGKDAVRHLLPKDAYDRLDIDVVPDLRTPPQQVYVKPGEWGRNTDAEIDLTNEAEIQQALERARKVQEAEGTLPPDGRPRMWHATNNRSGIATSGRVMGSTGGGLGGTMGSRGISMTYSGVYADAVQKAFQTTKQIDELWAANPTHPTRVQALVRWMNQDMYEVTEGAVDISGKIEELGYPQMAAVARGDMGIEELPAAQQGQVADQLLSVFDEATLEIHGDRGTRLAPALSGDGDDWFENVIRPQERNNQYPSYLEYRMEMATRDADHPLSPVDVWSVGRPIRSGSIYQDAGVLQMLNEHSLRHGTMDQFEVIEWDMEELLRQSKDAGMKVAAKRNFDRIDEPDPIMDWEAEFVFYGDVPVTQEYRMGVLGGRVPWVDPEVKYAVTGSQDSFRRAATEIELPHPSARVGGKWDKRGVQRMWREFEATAPGMGWTESEVYRPKLGAKPVRQGPDGRPEYADEDMIPVTRWTAPFTQRGQGVQDGIEDMLDMGPIQRKADDGVVDGQTKVLVPAGFATYMEVGGGAKLIGQIQDDSLLSMLKRLNGHVDVTILGRIQQVKKQYAALKAEPGADLDVLRRDEAKAIKDELAIGASQGLWQGNPKSFQWRKGWKPRLLETMPGQAVLITDPNAALEQTLRWGSALRLSDDAMSGMAEEMLAASTPEGRATILEGVMRAGRRAIVDVQFQGAPSRYADNLRLLGSLPDESLADSVAIRQHMIDNGADPHEATQAARYAAAVHSTALKATRMWNKGRDEATAYMRDLVARGDAEVRGPDGEPAAIPDSLLLAELIESTVPMPEPREVMRLTSRMGGWAQYALKEADRAGLGVDSWFKTKAGKAYDGFVDKFLETYTQSIFKPLVLVRGAYVARVIPEEQARLWASGWINTITRPVDYWLVTSGKRNTHMIDGRPWDAKQAITDNEPNLYAEAVGMRFRMSNTKQRAAQAVKSFDRRSANDFNDPDLKDYGYGYAVTLANLHFDPIVRRLAGGWKPSDLAEIPADVVSRGNNREMMSHWFVGSETGRRYLRAMIENQRKEPDLSYMWAQTPEGVDDFLDDMDTYLQTFARGDLELLDVVATGKYDGSPITRTDRWTDLDPNFAEWTTRRTREMDRTTLPDVKTVNKEWQVEHDGVMRRVSDAAMKLVIGAPTQALSRSPLFRSRYVDHVIDLLPIASQNAKARLLDNTDWMDDLTPQQQRRVRMAFKEVGDTDGAVEFEDLDLVAKGKSLDDVTGTLYDFGSKSVLSDWWRNIAPFFTAWTEAIQVWSRLFANNPRVFSRLNMALQGGQQENALDFMYNEDERYKGQGFFWKDDATNELKFTYPWSDMGGTFPLTGNVANLNMVATLTPGLGPTITLPAAAMMRPDTPSDGLYNLRRMMTMVNGGMAPSADPVNVVGLPSWSKNFIAAYAPQLGGSQTNSMWANARADALRYLASSEEGMLTDRDFDRRVNDLAQQSLIQRGIAQFFLPTVADHRATALANGRLTSGGQMIEQSVLSDQYRMYTDRYGFNEGNVKFFQDFGSGGFIASGGVNEYDGYLDYTATQWQFIRTNPELTSEYRDVIGLIAPPSAEGEGFNFDAYRYSQDSGMRQPKTSTEFQSDVQTRIARMVMNAAEAGGMSEEARRALRLELHNRFPLYTDFSGGAESRAQSITMMYEAAQDERVPEEVRRPLAAYLAARDEVLVAQGDNAGHYNPAWSAKKRQEGARQLYSYGLSLAQNDRGFTRAWKYLFSRELEGALN